MDRQFSDWRDSAAPSAFFGGLRPSLLDAPRTPILHSPAPTGLFGGLRPNLLDVPRAPKLRMNRKYIHSSTNFSENFIRLRSVFSPNARRKINENTL
ncbi:uncharacterized protein LOC133844387 isoform X2 [Drosophila sulfurigaster albostrigata]|uniref:uncharacterized protein LOC133844387 isoform X2 n=1 Tax=Drosophila sulfurigaster albostrigata TaxID=89887 RepID=UPI002D21AFDA|nr:uncharacterized protein LOC133844387 isoform X2 [Drosophila sulfurigaster albostrigata]